ncbi:MAG: pyridoxamine 5'-phosphate oxidase family protein [Spirochaetes bacterium]|nr:pyridoxamine 5'-phosphate oxidase family protein [Spirochaetota bacterium]
MRRRDKQVLETQWIDEVLTRAQVVRIAMAAGDEPYLVPMHFAHRDGTVYLHSAPQGKKIDMLRANPRVHIEATVDIEAVAGDKPCSFGTRYRSVMASGSARLLEGREEKREALELISEKYAGSSGPMDDSSVDAVSVIAVSLDGATGKRSGW